MKLGTLITVKQLAEALAKYSKNIRVLDSTWHPLATGRDAYYEYMAGHIPGAQFFDHFEECRDTSSRYHHMLPTPANFEDYVGSMGIRNDMHVVLYENNDFGFYSAPRAWYLFRAFGHDSVSLLDGGLPRWIAESQPISREEPCVPKENYKSNFKPEFVISLEQIIDNLNNKRFQLADTRSKPKFLGQKNEPSGLAVGDIPFIPGGHIPGSVSIHYREFITNNAGSQFQTLRPTEQLQEVFRNNGIDLTKPLVSTCGAGITACTLVLAAHMCGKPDVPVYDGSWKEYYDRKVRGDGND